MSRGNSFAGASFGNKADDVFHNRDENICQDWKQTTFKLASCRADVSHNSYGLVNVNGNLSKWLPNFKNKKVYIKYCAASPPTRGCSYSGSALPYANIDMAFEGTPNLGVLEVFNGSFDLSVEMPNSYYEHMGKRLVPPTVYFMFTDSDGNIISNGSKSDGIESIVIGKSTAFRTISWTPKRDWSSGADFYGNQQLPIRNQEQILRDSAMTKTEPDNFWGTRPPY